MVKYMIVCEAEYRYPIKFYEEMLYVRQKTELSQLQLALKIIKRSGAYLHIN